MTYNAKMEAGRATIFSQHLSQLFKRKQSQHYFKRPTNKDHLSFIKSKFITKKSLRSVLGLLLPLKRPLQDQIKLRVFLIFKFKVLT